MLKCWSYFSPEREKKCLHKLDTLRASAKTSDDKLILNSCSSFGNTAEKSPKLPKEHIKADSAKFVMGHFIKTLLRVVFNPK